MNQTYPEYWPQYFTATIHEWKHLLADPVNKDIIIECLRFLVVAERIRLYAFVIMVNHVHIIWQPLAEFPPSEIQASFTRFTAKKLKQAVAINHPERLAAFLVNKEDREYQIWKRRPLSIELRTAPVFSQKLEYIHYNPVKAGLCTEPEKYYYSSARFYNDGVDEFEILTHYSGN